MNHDIQVGQHYKVTYFGKYTKFNTVIRVMINLNISTSPSYLDFTTLNIQEI